MSKVSNEEKILELCTEYKRSPAEMLALLPELMEAAKPIVDILDAAEKKGISGVAMPGEGIEDWYTVPVLIESLRTLRSALAKAKGGET